MTISRGEWEAWKASIKRELDQKDAAHQRQHADLGEARTLSKEALDHRMDSGNYMREQLKDQAELFATSVEVEQMRIAIRNLELAHASLQARLYTVTGSLGLVIAVAGILIAAFR